jgi:hypothetical protein
MIRRLDVNEVLAPVCERGGAQMKRTVWMCAVIAAMSLAACGDGRDVGDDDDGTIPAGDFVCGNDVCEDGETPHNCPADCTPARCGDDTCNGDETVDTCPQDCVVCGDEVCSSTEDLASCPADCAVCGDSICSSTESATTCAQDCLAALAVQNVSSFTISGLYVYACGTSSFGSNLIAGRVISPNDTFTIMHVPPGCWNFHADATTGVFWDRFNTVLEGAKTFTWTLIN